MLQERAPPCPLPLTFPPFLPSSSLKVVELLCEGGACLPEGPLLAPFWQRLEGHTHEPQLAIPHLPCPDGDEVVIKSKAKEVAGSDKAAARAVRQPTPLQKKEGLSI